MTTRKIIYEIDAGGTHCWDVITGDKCAECDIEMGCYCKMHRKYLRYDNNTPLRCQDCLDAEKEYNELKRS